MGRRSSGEGSIYRRKDGRYVGQYRAKTPDGAKYRYIYGKTKSEVRRKLAMAIADRDAGLVYDDGGMNLGRYLDEWLRATEGTIREGTWRQYETIARLHIKPTLGSVRLSALDPLRVQALYRAKLDEGLSSRRVQYVHATLHRALVMAVKWRLIASNVCASVNPPRPQKKEMRPLDVGQVHALLRAAHGGRLEALYVLAITSGMRQGELLGLSWRDIDLRRGRAHVRRTLVHWMGAPRFGEPKNARSRRCVALAPQAVAALKTHRERQRFVGVYADDGLVFCTSSGRPISPTNLYKQSFRPLLERANLPHMRFHDLRHTCATLLLGKGVHPKIVQELLGHSSIRLTMDTYSHFLPDMQDAAADAMRDALDEPPEDTNRRRENGTLTAWTVENRPS